MCGIFGYLSENNLNDDAIVHSISNRGPDNNSFVDIDDVFLEKKCKFFHSRLSIIDVNSRSNQPLLDDTSNFLITYNGELYNYQELKRELITLGCVFKTESDTEVVLNAYKFWGENCFNKFRGMFAFCILDKKEQILIAARDPFGMKPLYFFYDNGNFLFSSLLISILNSGIKNKFKLDKSALKGYLSTGSFVDPDTIIHDIKSLLPGTYLLVKNNKLITKRYSFFRNYISPEKLYDYEYIKKGVREVMINSIEKHFLADVPIGVMLSGGIDSSIIAGVSSKILGKKISTFSIGYQNVKYKNIDETNIAQKTANFIKSNHENILIDYSDFNNIFEEYIKNLDIPSIDGFNTYIISKHMAKKVKVVLSGLGGDEMFAGYPIFKELYFLEQNLLVDKFIDYLPSFAKRRIGKQYLNYGSKEVNKNLINKRLLYDIDNRTKEKLIRKITKSTDLIDTISLYEIQQYMANTLLRDSDVMSMTNGLEIRVPFVDIDVLKFALKIPGNYKINKRINKPVLVDSFKDILLPEVFKTKKRGFSLPINKWAVELFENNQTRLLKSFNQYDLDDDFITQFNKDYINNPIDDYNKYKWGLLLMWIDKNKQFIA